MIYLLSALTTFGAVFLKGFQQKNVIGGHIKMGALTSYIIAFFDMASITLIVKGGWTIAFASGTGAAIGMVAAIHAHNRLFKSK
jgi:hypothetical protein